MSERFEPIPPCLATMPPGPALAGFLASIDVGRVSGYDRVIVLQAAHRQASHAQAQVYAAMVAVADHMDSEFPDDFELGWQAASTEIRAALRLTRRSADTSLHAAWGLCRRLPRLLDALRAGAIDPPRARMLAEGTSHLDETTARRVVDQILDQAAGLTTGQLRERVARLCIEAAPDSAVQRYQEAVDGRRVVMEATPDGTAHLMGLDLPPDRVVEIARRIDRIAKQLNRNGETRSIDQLRADVFLDLLAGKRDPKGGFVDIHVDLTTLTQLAESPGDLAGYGPVVADIARQVTAANTNGEWRFTITDPQTGQAVHNGTTRRRPTATQRRTIEARHRVCVFPGCRMPARQSDLDHRTPWSQRRVTDTADMGPGCRHDHITNRHHIGWRYQPLPGGDHLWTSPLGHQYTTSGRKPP